ncbi:riboflavin synthase Ecym_4395 [Eremothecium cymbalariae DBVPG|uniref:Riboflavin synthase n=1 Tax=Eremothecium cymbalariae (strain CBS 270.75 / DBVPG 7215 / KCTC 17166 / NRRL Y-17582) TaxID=931890 RepID=G8JTU6_ERECY|nr:hypothetical protein Ecym_4395 [Eremothecium cymbalariae DBVPG\
MFTGLVELIGTVVEYKEQDATEMNAKGVVVTIKDAAPILSDCHIGDSIACNGICLSVIQFDSDSIKVGVSPETIKRTEISFWKPGMKVNLERAVSHDVRFGGHYVQGHVDTVAELVSKTPEDDSIVFGFKLRDIEYAKYIVEKGYVAVDGTSLTVTKVENDTFYISMIAHTQNHVAIPLKSVGDLVNIEVDITGKVIEKQVLQHLETQLGNQGSALHNVIAKIVDAKVKEYLK